MTDANETPELQVMKQACETCIYREDSPLNLENLEGQVKDPYIGFNGYRICHNHDSACCRGFWNRHKDEFPAGQIAQRLDLVVLVEPTRHTFANHSRRPPQEDTEESDVHP